MLKRRGSGRGFDRYAQGKGADAAHWLSMHNADSITVDRKTGCPPTIYVPTPSVSVTGGIQPGILDRIVGTEHRESGLLARLLLAMPPRRAKQWHDAEIPKADEAAVEAIFDRLLSLDFTQDDDGNAQPIDVPLTPGGKQAWIRFYNEHGHEQAKLTGDLSAAWSKLEGYTARLALVVHFVRWAADDSTLADRGRIDEASIDAGVTLSRWFGYEARQLYDFLAESDEDREQRRLVELIEGKGGSVTVRELMRSSRMFASAEDVEAALKALADADLGHWEEIQPGAKGGRPTRRFKLTDAGGADTVDVDNTPAGDTGNGGSGSVNGVNGPNDEADADDWGVL